jgi:hypothetical protein
MDEWGFGIWVVPVALSAALCYVAATHFESGRSRMAKAVHRFLLGYSWIGLGLVTILVIMHL